MTGDVDVYDEHAEALIRFATVLVGSGSAVGVVSAAVRRTLVARTLAHLNNPRAALLRNVYREARSVGSRLDRVVPPTRRLRRHRNADSVGIGSATRGEASNAVLQLSLWRRAAVYLIYVADLDSFEAAHVMRVPPFVVRRYLTQAGTQCRTTSPASSPWFRRRFRQALAVLVAEAPRPPRFETIVTAVTPVRSHHRPATPVVIAAVATVAGIVGVSGVLRSPVELQSLEPPAMEDSVPSSLDAGLRIVAPDPGPEPGPLAPCCAERPFGVGVAVGRNDVTLALRNQLSDLIDQVDIPGVDPMSAVLWPAAVIRDDLYTVVARDDVPVGVIKTTDAVFSGFGASSTLWQEAVTHKNWGWITTSRVVWSGVPQETAVVRVTIPDGRTLLQRPVGQTVFFDLAIPGWNQIATFTAFDSSGSPLATRKLELDGGGCSGRLAQIPFKDRTLPDEVGAVRMSLLDTAIRCDTSSVEQIIRARPGTSISLNSVDRVYGLDQLDLVYPIMLDIGRVLKEPWTVEQGPVGGVYVWSLESNDDVLQVRVSLIP